MTSAEIKQEVSVKEFLCDSSWNLNRNPGWAYFLVVDFPSAVLFSLIVVINLLNRFVIFDVCACLWSALWGI